MIAAIPSSIYLLPLYVSYGYSLTLPNLPAFNDWPTNSSDLDLNDLPGYNHSNVPNISLLASQYPRDFSMSIAYSGPKLNITSMIYNTVDAMKQMALQDFFEVVQSPEVFVLEGHLDSGIGITPFENPVRGLERRFAVWGMAYGASEMYHEKKFQQAEITLRWKKKAIGTVEFLPKLETPSLSLMVGSEVGNNTSTLLSRAAAGEGNPTAQIIPSPNLATNKPQTLQTLAVSSSPVQTTYRPNDLLGAKIPILSVFLSILQILAALASSPKDTRADKFIYVVRELDTAVAMCSRARDRAPYLEYGWVIFAVAGLLPYMIQAGTFKAVKMEMTLDGKEVGWGVFGDKNVFG